MLIGITARIKNGLLMQYREREGLTQRQAADIAGVTQREWSLLECMRFKSLGLDRVRSIALCIKVDVEDIYPEELRNKDLTLLRTLYRDVEANLIEARSSVTRMMLPSPAKTVEHTESMSKWKSTLGVFVGRLNSNQKLIITRRFGLDGCERLTLTECARLVGLTRERVRQLEANALYKLEIMAKCDGEVRQMFLDD